MGAISGWLWLILAIIRLLTKSSSTTHIDNPKVRRKDDPLASLVVAKHAAILKGYGEGYGDPREVYQGLRPPVDPEELELNDENGMKV